MRLKDQVAVITGGANGIGRTTVARFRQEGARVAIWDVAEPAETPNDDEQLLFQKVDVSDPNAVENAAADVVQKWGRIDILINNAGILRDAQLAAYKEGELKSRMRVEDFDDVIRVNLRGVFICTRAVAPIMIRQQYGRIISASSVVGIYGNFGQTNYVAAKAGVIGMTRVWARELGRHNITVNAVAPGFIQTEMINNLPEKVLESMLAKTPLRRLGKPEDIANAFVFLAEPDASFISGAILSVDGGLVVGT
ncbi:MAG: 3-oxoacyl-ACP reductase [Anaerolineae bacterium UTCFX2]|jgi:3-oxoacyl-[acyl-carrier protein] reductase|nr:3-oxoacyl-ACP reductase FabG [Anaerolineales bacterium]OQY92074.1 MAG: 3-oxoacyl-ACP reductase [Anaerolineae bacterium UTCFX2]